MQKLCSTNAKTVLDKCENCSRQMQNLCSTNAKLVLDECENCTLEMRKLCSTNAKTVPDKCKNLSSTNAKTVLYKCKKLCWTNAKTVLDKCKNCAWQMQKQIFWNNLTTEMSFFLPGARSVLGHNFIHRICTENDLFWQSSGRRYSWATSCAQTVVKVSHGNVIAHYDRYMTSWALEQYHREL